MREPVFLLLFLVSFFFPIYAETGIVSFESYDMPGWYMGVVEEEATLLKPDTEQNREYTTFRIVPGLFDETQISIQSATDSDYYLRHQRRIIKLHEYSTWSLYKKDATFLKEPGLADTKNHILVTFKAWNYPNMSIRHRDGEVLIEESEDNEEFKKSATFIVKPPNWGGTMRVTKKRKCVQSFNRSRAATITVFFYYMALVVIAILLAVFRLRNKGKPSGMSGNRKGVM